MFCNTLTTLTGGEHPRHPSEWENILTTLQKGRLRNMEKKPRKKPFLFDYFLNSHTRHLQSLVLTKPALKKHLCAMACSIRRG